MAHHQILIVGGGAAGITAAAQLKRARPSLDVAILEPSGEHYYQPGWTLVGGGVFSMEETRRAEGDVIPSGVHWIRAGAAAFDPERGLVTSTEGEEIHYDVLIVAAGLRLCWEKIEGLSEALGKGGVCSNYSKEFAAYTWEAIEAFQGGREGRSGNAVFTCPPMPIKCPGAPQKIAYLADDVFKKKRLQAQVIYATATPGIFGVPTYAAPLREVVKRHGIDARYNHVLTAVRGQAPVLVANLLAFLDGQPLEAAYDGYSCCPLITGYGKAIMAEFNYEQQPVPSFPLDPTKERWSMWFIKRKILPSLYWNRMLTGGQHERRFVPGVKR